MGHLAMHACRLCFVNGEHITEGKVKLNHDDRIILGVSHAFHLYDPKVT